MRVSLAPGRAGRLPDLGGGAAPKKLRGAARRWLGGQPGTDELEADAAAAGIKLPPEAFAQGDGDGFVDGQGRFHVLPANWNPVAAFLACGSQWRWAQAGAGGAVVSRLAGLDYAGCRAAVAALGLAWREVFPGLQTMEGEAMKEQGNGQDGF